MASKAISDAQSREEVLRKEQENVSCIFLAEYSKLTGSPELCFQYPPPGKTSNTIDLRDRQWIGQQMIPERTSLDQDGSLFFLNYKHEKTNFEYPTKEEYTINAIVFGVDDNSNKWILLDSCNIGKNIGMIESLDESIVRLEIDNHLPVDSIARIVCSNRNTNEVFLSINVNQNLNYAVLNQNYHESGRHFVSFYTDDDETMGLIILEDVERRFRQHVKYAQERHREQNDCIEHGGAALERPFLYCLNFIKRQVSRDGTPKVMAMALCSPQQYFFVFKGILRAALDEVSSGEKDQETTVALIYNKISQMNIDPLHISDMEKRVWRWSVIDNGVLHSRHAIQCFGKSFNMLVPLALQEDEIGDERVSVTKLVSKFHKNTMLLYNAILEERRVIFFASDAVSVRDLCFTVVSSILLLCPTLHGILQRRVVPYVNMAQFMQRVAAIPGFIIGITDPAIINKDQWDILCNVETGDVTSNRSSYGTSSPQLSEFENRFIMQILHMLNSHALRGFKADISETFIRGHFQQYTQRIIDITFERAEFDSEETRQTVINSTAETVELWKRTDSFGNYVKRNEEQERHIKSVDVLSYINILRARSDIPEQEIVHMFEEMLGHVVSKEQMMEFLSYMPESEGGLYPITSVLLHPSPRVRHLVVKFLKRIESFEEGTCCISQLNGFLMMSFDRLCVEMENASVAVTDNESVIPETQNDIDT